MATSGALTIAGIEGFQNGGPLVVTTPLEIVLQCFTYYLYNIIPGGHLIILGGRIRSLSKLKNTPKALNSGQKSTLNILKR